MNKSNWTIEQIIAKLNEINQKGFINIPQVDFRSDEGVVGQILEREFGVSENNLSLGDLGDFELKGMRKRSTTLTLCHKTSDSGMTPIEIFDRFGYVKPSNRDSSVMKKKLFCTVKGSKPNTLGLQLKPHELTFFDLFYGDEFICRWNLTDSLGKIDRMILVLADTRGNVNTLDESFHYNEAYLLNKLKDINSLISDGVVVVDFCIDQIVDSPRVPHDRGPHIRVPKSKLKLAYQNIEKIM